MHEISQHKIKIYNKNKSILVSTLAFQRVMLKTTIFNITRNKNQSTKQSHKITYSIILR